MNQAVLAPVFALIALLLGLMPLFGWSRVSALQSGAVRARDIVLGQQAWPPRATLLGRAFQNQLELPLVFYILVALVLATKSATPTFVGLEWTFVALRWLHAGIHVTTNHLLARFLAFLAGALVLMAMWVWFALRVYS